jgi:glycosyltransferase involved in cell wall biosynthesis
MTVRIYPADDQACGHYRLIWPAESLQKQGFHLELNRPNTNGSLSIEVKGDEVTQVRIPDDTDVVVLQRVTHSYFAQLVPLLRSRGIAVVVDVDDDLRRIHPSHAAYAGLHPRQSHRTGQSWQHLVSACKAATLVTATTPALLDTYAPSGRGHLLPNYLAEHSYVTGRSKLEPVRLIGWPATLSSHPHDPDVTCGAIRRVLERTPDAELQVVGDPGPAAVAFAVPTDRVTGAPMTTLLNYPRLLADLDIGIAPLAPTVFSAAKSWLKPLELAAAGVPWVGSPSPEYRALHDLGCGLLATRPKDWYRQLARLIDSRSLRVELAAAGRKVAASLHLEDHAWKWAEAWDRAARMEGR